MMQRIILAILLFALSPRHMLAAPQDDGTLTVTGGTLNLSLEDAVRYALKHNINIKNAKVDVALQRAKNSEITGIALPQINAKNDFTAYPNPIQSFVPAQFFDPNAPDGQFQAVTFTPKFGNTLSVSGSQILFDGSILVALQARNTLIHLSELGVRASETDVRYNVQRAYYGLVVAQKQYEILKGSIIIFRDVYNDLSALKQEGFVEKIDVDRAAVQLNNLTTDSLRIANLLTLSEQLLKYNMGMRLDRDVMLTDTSLTARISEIGSKLETSLNYSLRTEYQQLQTALRLNEYDLKRYRYKSLPTVALFGTAAYTYSSNKFRDVASASNYLFYSLAGVQINVPIFTGFQRRYQVVQAKLNIDKIQNNLDLLTQSIDLQTAQFRTSLRNALLTVQSQERNMELANTVLDLSRKKYKAGVGSNLEVTQAQGDLLQAQNNYFSALLDVVNARTDLSKADGTLSPAGSSSTLQSGNDVAPADNDRSGDSPSNPGNISNPGKTQNENDGTDR